MDSQDSSGHPTHHHHHQRQPPHAVMMNNPHQQLQFSNNNSNSLMHPHQQQQQQQQQNTRFPFNSMAAKPLDHNNSYSNNTSSIDPGRKKRGRPRKYTHDDHNNNIGLGLSPNTPAAQISSSIMVHHNDSGGAGDGTHESEALGKRNRGRPPSSVKRQLDALGCPGVGFTPHVITVETGEDIASRIMAFSQQGPRTVCILSANGAIHNVTLRQAATSGGTVAYEGRFEIISLSGSFQLSESNGNLSRTGGLSVSLAGSDGRVLGGGVAGMLQAASPVQIIVGSFIADGKKPKSSSSSMPSSTSTPPPPSHMLNFGAQGTGASHSQDDESSDSGEDNDDSPGSGDYGNANAGQPIQNMNIYSNMGWPNSMKMPPN